MSPCIWARTGFAYTGAILMLLLVSVNAAGEQMQRFGDWEVHYVVLPSGFLKPDIAASYDIIRGRDRAFINISALDPQRRPAHARVRGSATNLLGQQQPLGFREITEGSAVYYVADLKHDHEETLRFEITVTPEGQREMRLEFQQKLYWEEP